jgi:hypothetical protein
MGYIFNVDLPTRFKFNPKDTTEKKEQALEQYLERFSREVDESFRRLYNRIKEEA